MMMMMMSRILGICICSDVRLLEEEDWNRQQQAGCGNETDVPYCRTVFMEDNGHTID